MPLTPPPSPKDPLTVQARMTDLDFFGAVPDESLGIDEEFSVGDEESVFLVHVFYVCGDVGGYVVVE